MIAAPAQGEQRLLVGAAATSAVNEGVAQLESLVNIEDETAISISTKRRGTCRRNGEEFVAGDSTLDCRSRNFGAGRLGRNRFFAYRPCGGATLRTDHHFGGIGWRGLCVLQRTEGAFETTFHATIESRLTITIRRLVIRCSQNTEIDRSH